MDSRRSVVMRYQGRRAISQISSPLDLAIFLGLGIARAAALLGIHRNTMLEPATPGMHQKMQPILIVLNGLRERAAGDDDLAAFWFRNLPIPLLGHHTAEFLLREIRKTPAEILAALEISNG